MTVSLPYLDAIALANILKRNGYTVTIRTPSTPGGLCCVVFQAVDAMRAIQAILSGNEWSPDTLDAIAQIVRESGYPVDDNNE